MFFRLELALAALPELGGRSLDAVERLLPGPLTLLLPNPDAPLPARLRCRAGAAGPARAAPRRRARAAGGDALAGAPVERQPVGWRRRPPARGRGPAIRARVDLQLDGGELPGTPSTVLDLTAYEREGSYEIVREGAVSAADLARRLTGA